MLHEELIDRINVLARKAKSEGLTEEEKTEQKELRTAYLKAFRSGMTKHIEGMKVVDQEGNDVTPQKLKDIQKAKGLHNRDNES